MWKGLDSRRRSKYLKTWAVIAVVMAALSFSVIAGAADSGAQQPTSPPAPSFLDQFKSNTLSLAALLGALTGIFMFLAKVFKPFKH